MKVAVISDIHGNYDALEAVLEECSNHKVEQYIFLGDYVGYYYEPKKVWDRINELEGVMIKGNHEDLLNDSFSSSTLSKTIEEKYGVGHQIALEQFSASERQQICGLQAQKVISYYGYKFQINHGTPWDQNAYLYPDTDEDIFEKANQPEFDFVLVGHSHYPFIKRLSHSTIINPGSVGQNRKEGGVANWAFMDLETNSLEIMNTYYSVIKLAQKVKKHDPNVAYNHSILFRK
ncbi:YfcE family phosphodiesterase [Flavobacteriaceae bacterium]|nr:YfcE family phosphodiesterase [Flavobacteriaceae bacterium]